MQKIIEKKKEKIRGNVLNHIYRAILSARPFQLKHLHLAIIITWPCGRALVLCLQTHLQACVY